MYMIADFKISEENKTTVFLAERENTAIVRLSRMCDPKYPVYRTFCTNKGSKILSFELIRTPFKKLSPSPIANFRLNFQFTSLIWG